MDTINRQYIHEIVARHGPDPCDYPELMQWYSRIMSQCRAGVLDEKDIVALWDNLGEALSPKTLHGFAARTPHGYHGDYEIIDRIYTEWISDDPKLQKWDLFFHSQSAAKAVRNRKAYFCTAVDEICQGGSFNVLVLGSGPARDVLECLQHDQAKLAIFHCVDQDADALSYAASLLNGFSNRVKFYQANVNRALPEGNFDLVWAGGLFDYFSDRIFVYMLKRLFKRLTDGGRLIVGNFQPTNPTRDYMEFAGWVLNYRNERDLLNLGMEAGILKQNTRVTSEAEGVNLFLQVVK